MVFAIVADPAHCQALVEARVRRYNTPAETTDTAKKLACFPNTRWSVVLAATKRHSPESAAALEIICGAYWYRLYAYVRRSGHSPQDAEDLTQEFFCRHLHSNGKAVCIGRSLSQQFTSSKSSSKLSMIVGPS
jgi:hypothetical protein